MSADSIMFHPGDLVPLELEEVERGVFVTPFLSVEAAERLLAHADRRMAAPDATGPDATGPDATGPGAHGQPSSMHDHGVALESLGMAGWVDDLLDRAAGLGQLLTERFAEVGGDSIDGHYSYLVDYGKSGDEDLGFHVDDSEVTLNLCLGETFSGSELVMLGRRCDAHRQTPVQAGETVEILHEPGSLVVHAGRHRHRVDPIRRGRRRNLIAWLRSSKYRSDHAAKACPDWCGWGYT